MFIYSSKMIDNDYIIIPQALYERIKKFQKSVLNETSDARYLFYYGKKKDMNKPINTYTKHVKKYISE